MKKEFTLRTALPGDGQAIFHVTRQSIAELSNGMYTPEQLNGWMGERTPEFYEQLIKQGQMVVALQLGRIVGFVDSEPGEVTRLFLLLEASSKGLGAHLLKIGVGLSRDNGRQEAILKSFPWRLPCIHLLAVTTPMSSRPKRLR